MKGKSILAILSILMLFVSCTKEMNIATDWKDIYIVYSILNPEGSAHYVRVNRAFQSATDAWQFTTSLDSVNIKPEDLEEELLMKSQNRQIEERIILLPSQDFEKDTGTFASKNYFTYKITHILHPGKTYHLIIKHLPSTYQMQAEPRLLGKYNMEVPLYQQRCYTSAAYHKELIDYSDSLGPNQFDILFYRRLYEELTDFDTIRKYLNWKPYAIDFNLNNSKIQKRTNFWKMYQKNSLTTNVFSIRTFFFRRVLADTLQDF